MQGQIPKNIQINDMRVMSPYVAVTLLPAGANSQSVFCSPNTITHFIRGYNSSISKQSYFGMLYKTSEQSDTVARFLFAAW